eukprot:135419-Amorphochlora_amoeboformis.AAC.1
MVDEDPTEKGWGIVIVICGRIRRAQHKVNDGSFSGSKNAEELGFGKGDLRTAVGQDPACGRVETPRMLRSAENCTLNLADEV